MVESTHLFEIRSRARYRDNVQWGSVNLLLNILRHMELSVIYFFVYSYYS